MKHSKHKECTGFTYSNAKFSPNSFLFVRRTSRYIFTLLILQKIPLDMGYFSRGMAWSLFSLSCCLAIPCYIGPCFNGTWLSHASLACYNASVFMLGCNCFAETVVTKHVRAPCYNAILCFPEAVVRKGSEFCRLTPGQHFIKIGKSLMQVRVAFYLRSREPRTTDYYYYSYCWWHFVGLSQKKVLEWAVKQMAGLCNQRFCLDVSVGATMTPA